MSPIHNDRKHRLHLIPILVGIVAIALIPFIYFLHGATADSPASYVEKLIGDESTHVLSIDKNKIETAELRNFYVNREYAPVWYDGNQLKMDARFFVEIVENAAKDGFHPDDYYLGSIKSRLTTLDDKKSAELEVALTSAFFKFATHLRNGRVPKPLADKIWPLHPAYLKADEFLAEALRHNDLFKELFAQNPPHSQYQKLRKVLTQLYEVAEKGGWPTLPRNQVIKPGITDGRIIALRKRLKIAGDLPADTPENATYDEQLKQAVIAFQRRHGILADGVLGADTIDTLNVPVEKRIEQVILNLERWRLMPRELGYRYILVNASGYELVAVKEGQPDLTMRVIVGARDLQTPIFSSYINKIVLNPEWTVPRGITVKELLPKQLKNRSYFKANNYRLESFSTGAIVDPDSVDWNAINENNFPYQLVQRSGRGNPLGKIKFFIPNEHDVYLHDTNNHGLFNNVIRDLSHGCIRLEFPMQLAKFVLKADSTWTESRLNEGINTGQTIDVRVNDQVPVHIVYFTAWVDNQGRINFYKDVYKRDEELQNALGFTAAAIANKTANRSAG